MANHDPYPDEDTDRYEYTGTGLSLPGGTTVEPGDTVALPDRIAEHVADQLVPVAEQRTDGPEAGESEPEPDTTEWDIPGDDDPVWDDYNALRRLASDTPVDGRQGHDDLAADLRDLRDSHGE